MEAAAASNVVEDESVVVVIVVVNEASVVVDVYVETVTSALTGMLMGQKIHVLRVTDQYRSRTSRRYPTARRFEMHLAASSRSYKPAPKQAEESDTAGWVTKLIGIWPATSRSLCTGVSFDQRRGRRLTRSAATQVGSFRVFSASYETDIKVVQGAEGKATYNSPMQAAANRLDQHCLTNSYRRE